MESTCLCVCSFNVSLSTYYEPDPVPSSGENREKTGKPEFWLPGSCRAAGGHVGKEQAWEDQESFETVIFPRGGERGQVLRAEATAGLYREAGRRGRSSGN